MIKLIFVLAISLLFLQCANAQKRDTSVYYLDNAGRVVSAKESANFIVEILPPDTSVNKSLFIVKEFYSNGKLALIGNSTTNEMGHLIFQGPQIIFFQNGHKASVKNYENGKPAGDVIDFYPNGKLYSRKTLTKDNKLLYNECRDSTGTIVVANGNGKGIIFIDDGFKSFIEGSVINGLEEGEWRGKQPDSVSIVRLYKNGQEVSSQTFDKNGNVVIDKIFTAVEVEPQFQGGLNDFGKFLAKNIHYPAIARENGTQGKVIISFIVEKDGSLTNIKVQRGIGDNCDEEALRVIKLSSPWIPGYQQGKPVRVAYSVPISFSMQ